MTLTQKFSQIPHLKFSFSKSTEFSQTFARDCGALSMYDIGFGLGIPSNFSPENKLRAVFNQVMAQGGIFLFNLSSVDMKKAKKGFADYDEAEYNNQITEWELFMVLTNQEGAFQNVAPMDCSFRGLKMISDDKGTTGGGGDGALRGTCGLEQAGRFLRVRG